MIVIRDLKAFYSGFDWPKDVDNSLKHEIELIIKSNESLAENKIKSEIERLLSKYKHENNIYEMKTAKQMYHINLISACHKDQT